MDEIVYSVASSNGSIQYSHCAIGRSGRPLVIDVLHCVQVPQRGSGVTGDQRTAFRGRCNGLREMPIIAATVVEMIDQVVDNRRVAQPASLHEVEGGRIVQIAIQVAGTTEHYPETPAPSFPPDRSPVCATGRASIGSNKSAGSLDRQSRERECCAETTEHRCRSFLWPVSRAQVSAPSLRSIARDSIPIPRAKKAATTTALVDLKDN